MVGFKKLLFGAAALLSTASAATTKEDLIGTWTSKSARVITGPGFYNPINDSFTEPYSPGISYSFTATHYESALYRVIANASDPRCPGASLQFQHGTYSFGTNNSLVLKPFAVDGRQMLSQPCQGEYSVYERFNTSETMRDWTVSEDKYKRVKRLDLGKFDGTPIQPLYLAYKPPMMLPTETMNPTGASSTPLSTVAVGKEKTDEDGKTEEEVEENAKRGLEGDSYEARRPRASRGEPLNKDAKLFRRSSKMMEPTGLDYAKVFLWASIGMIGFGGLTLVFGRGAAKATKAKRTPVSRVQLQ